MENSSGTTGQTNTLVNSLVPVQTPLSQSTPIQPVPESQQQNYWKLAVIVLVIFVLGLGGGLLYVLQKQIPSQPIVSQVAPTLEPSQAAAEATNETNNWKTYADDALGLTFTYPSDTIIEKDKNGGFWIRPFVHVNTYVDSTKSEYYRQNKDLYHTTQTELKPVVLDGISYNLSKLEWADGGGPSNGVPNCTPGTDQSTYFVDIPNKASISFAFQTVTICDADKGKIIEKQRSGEKIPNFDDQLNMAYQILATFKFTK